MNVVEELLNNRFIIKALEKEKYYRIREELEPAEKFLKESLGYPIIVNPLLIKLEKIPGKVEPWMGIQDFKTVMDYGFLCVILMFLEDKEQGEQFILSQLTEYIQGKYTLEKIDWTNFQMRRGFIRVVKFCEKENLFFINDGKIEAFASDATQEVLYENTGSSRYFMKNFNMDISGYKEVKDFENTGWLDLNADRGVLRRHRVYRRLLMSIGVYKETENDEDFNYIKNYWNRMIEPHFQEWFDCEIQVYKQSAYLVLDKESRLGKHFPEDKGISDIVLLLSTLIWNKVKMKKLSLNFDETINLSMAEFDQLIGHCRELYGNGFGKKHRDLTTTEFVQEVKDYMAFLAFIVIDEDKQGVKIYPAIGKLKGEYPEDFEIKNAFGGTNGKALSI